MQAHWDLPTLTCSQDCSLGGALLLTSSGQAWSAAEGCRACSCQSVAELAAMQPATARLAIFLAAAGLSTSQVCLQSYCQSAAEALHQRLSRQS